MLFHEIEIPIVEMVCFRILYNSPRVLGLIGCGNSPEDIQGYWIHRSEEKGRVTQAWQIGDPDNEDSGSSSLGYALKQLYSEDSEALNVSISINRFYL